MKGSMNFSMSRGSGTRQKKFMLLAFVSFPLMMSSLCAGCFEETQLLVLNKDGSGHYESVVRFNPQMSAFAEMTEKVVAVKGLPSVADSPFGIVLPNLEISIRAKVEQIEGVRLLHIETTRFGEQDDQKQIAFAIDFDNINTFLSSPLGLEELGLKLSKDSEGNLHLKGTPSALVATPPTGGGVPSLGLIISQMKSEIGIAGDPNFDKLLRRLLNSPKSTLTFATPAPVKQTNGTLVQDNKVEWNVDIITAASTPSGNLLLSPSFLMIRVKTSLWERVHVGVNLLCEDRRRYEGLITNTPNCLSARQVCQRMAPHCCRLQGPPCVQEIL